MSKKSIYFGWIFISVVLLLYSFTQVDLNLTLSQISIWQLMQKLFQYIGYFQRPLSTILYVSIIFVLFLLYIVTLQLVRLERLGRRQVWKITLIISAILLFSYNAFSYDLFNYMFDARIFTYYHQNPYQHKPLDFFTDPMLNFMRSTHRTYPYGITWLGLTIPLSFIGFQIFLLTFYLFKALTVASYIGSVYFLEKILVRLNMKNVLLGAVFFALNPLVLIESLVSAHNDIVMIFFALAAYYFLLKRNYVFAFLLLLLSIGIKFTTIFLIPIFIVLIVLQTRKEKIEFEKVSFLSFLLMILAAIAMSISSGPKTPEPQPWYLVNVIPFAAMVSYKKLVTVLVFFVSLGTLLFYVPFLYSGEWPKNIIEMKLWILFISLILGIITYFITKKTTQNTQLLNL